MRLRWILPLLALLAAVSAATAQTTLPPAPWYAVLWTRGSDQLHWINGAQVAHSLQRPRLPQEQAATDLRLAFTRDGRYLLQAGKGQRDLDVLGIYDLAAGKYTAAVTAQPRMNVHLGETYASSADGYRVAVGFAAEDAADGFWQVIVFELATGAPLAFLDSGAVAAEAGTAYSFPRITLYESGQGALGDAIHFQLLPKLGALPETLSAFLWPSQAGATVQPSPYSRLSYDLDVETGHVIYAYESDEAQARAQSAAGSRHNAIALLLPDAGGAAPQTIYRDQRRSLSSPQWANGGEWIAIYSESGDEGVSVGWQILPLADAQAQAVGMIPLAGNVRAARGTPDGLLTLSDNGELRHVTSLDDLQGTLLYQPPGNQLELVQIVYVSETPATFALQRVADPAP